MSLSSTIAAASFGVTAIRLNIARAKRDSPATSIGEIYWLALHHNEALTFCVGDYNGREGKMAKFDASKDYYRELGVDVNATQDEIDRAFRNEARRRHPDRGGSEEGMKSLNEARDVLSDPATRLAYDSERAPQQIAFGSSAAYDPEAASRAGTLKIPVADEDVAGLVISAAACFVIGAPMLMLVKRQGFYFLWPLQFLLLGALGLGVFLSYSALKIKHKKWQTENPSYRRSLFVFHEVVFWLIAIAFVGMVIAMVYFV